MTNNDLNILADKLIEQLLAFDFPYKDILKTQIISSQKSVAYSTAYFCITFAPERTASPLPDWLPLRPVLWQVSTDDAPILGQLFLREGYVEKYEVIDFGFQEIAWHHIWEGSPQFDIEYNMDTIFQILTERDFTITNISYGQCSIDIELLCDTKHIIASFRDCTVRRWQNLEMPRIARMKIESDNESSAYYVKICETELEFQCRAVYLQHHTRWCYTEC